MTRVRVVLPTHLRELAGTGREVVVELEGPPTLGAVLEALEARHPALRGTVREPGTDRRRAYLRIFACGEDLSHDPPDRRLPEAVVSGDEALRVVGAVAGG